jgi:hypothetical protein
MVYARCLAGEVAQKKVLSLILAFFIQCFSTAGLSGLVKL